MSTRLQLNRRQFAMTAGTVGMVATLPACWFSNVYSSLNKYIPIALLAFDRILDILKEHAVPVEGLTDAVNGVKAALADIQAAIIAYEHAAGDKSSAIAHIRAALEVAEDRIEDFWRKLRLPNPELGATIRALLGIILSTLAGFEMKLPGAPVTRSVWAAPEARSVEKFRRDFNRTLDEHGESQFAI